jgi:hypothetical protein
MTSPIYVRLIVMILWTYSVLRIIINCMIPPPPRVGWLSVKILRWYISEIIRQRVLSHLARPAHIWNSSPGVFYSPAQQAGRHEFISVKSSPPPSGFAKMSVIWIVQLTVCVFLTCGGLYFRFGNPIPASVPL